MKIINKVALSTTAVLIATLMGSCKKSFLEPQPLSFYTPENTFNTVEGLKSSLIACERNLRYEWFGDGAPIITQNIFSEVAIKDLIDSGLPERLAL